MALLTPNYQYEINGVLVCEKIIPDGTRWKDASKAAAAGFEKGELYKKNKPLSNGTGIPKFITIHNTNDIDGTYDDGEQYTRATYNENMRSARVHLYIDDVCAWQNLRMGTGLCPADPEGEAEVGWHAGDGSNKTGGNMTSIGIEVIMNDNEEHDAKAYDNSARIVAWLLWHFDLDIDKVVSHTYWVNKSAGNIFEDSDEQSTNYVAKKKWCPTYIFKTTSHDKALANWKKYKALINTYLTALREPEIPSESDDDFNLIDDSVPDEWASEAVNFAVSNGLLYGDEHGNYKLHKNCTRQEMLVFLHRIYNYMKD